MRKLLALTLSLLMVFTFIPMAMVTASAADENVWLYVGADGTVSGKTYTKTDYPDAADALQAAYDEVSSLGLTGNPRKFLCINQDMTLSKQIVNTNGANLLRLQNIGYTVTAPEGSSAINCNGKSIWIYGNKDSVPSKDSYVASKGNAFFENCEVQLGGKIAGDLSFKDAISFKLLGGNYNSTFTGSFIFSGTIGTTATESSSSSSVVKGALDYSAVTTEGKESIFANLVNYPSYLKFEGGVISEPVEVVGTETDALSLKSEASIRLGTVCGIRFYTAFDASKIEGTVVEKGTLIGPDNLIGNYLTFEDKEAENAVAVKYEADTLWAGDEFVGSIVGINSWNYNRAFTARAYVKLDDGTYLYSATTTTKTVADIADAYIENDSDAFNALDDTTKELVQKWADANN